MASDSAMPGLRIAFASIGKGPLRRFFEAHDIKLDLDWASLPDKGFAEEVHRAFGAYPDKEKWARCMSGIHEVMRVKKFMAKKGGVLQEDIGKAGKLSEALDFLGSQWKLEPLIVFIYVKWPEYWKELQRKAVNAEKGKNGSKFWCLPPAEKPDAEEAARRFTEWFTSLMIEFRGKMENVYIEHNSLGESYRDVIHFDPFPIDEEYFDDSEGAVGKLECGLARQADQFAVVCYPAQRMIKIKGEGFSRPQLAKIAEGYIKHVLGGERCEKAIEEYDLGFFNTVAVTLPQGDDWLVSWRVRKLSFVVNRPGWDDHSFTVESHEGDVYQILPLYLGGNQFDQAHYDVLGVEFEVCIHTGEKPPEQPDLFGENRAVWPEKEYTVVLTKAGISHRCTNPNDAARIEQLFSRWKVEKKEDGE